MALKRSKVSVTNGTNSIVKLLLAIIAVIAACLFTISKLHDDGTMLLASMAEEYSVCTNVNACSDDDLSEMTDLLLEQDEYNSRMWLRLVLGWEQLAEELRSFKFW